MTRRIDELGRLVIPKEIRRNLKIKDNDQVEINVVDNKIILNKYESVSKDRNISIILNCIKRYLNKSVLFTSREKIIDYSLAFKEKITNNELNEDIVNIIEKRKEINSFGNINEIINNVYYLVIPLVINGDIYGSIIVYSNEEILDKDNSIMNFIKIFLENYLE